MIAVERLEARRMLSAGDQDLSFGTNGFVELKLASGRFSLVPGSDPLGKTTVVSVDSGGKSFIIRELNQGVAGKTLATIAFPFVPGMKGDVPEPGRVWTLPDGKKLVEFSVKAQYENRDGYIVRLNSDWTMDTSYGSGGAIFFPSGFRPDAVQQGDKFLVPESNGRNFVRRLTQTGEMDTTFGNKGFVEFEGYVRNIALAPDGKILVIADDSPASVYRLLPDGTADPTFGGGDGRAEEPKGVEATTGLSVDAAGRITVSGNKLVRFKPDGSIDRTFGTNGVAELLPGSVLTEQSGEVVLGNNQLIAPYGAGNLVRFDESGHYDPAFGRVSISLFLARPDLRLYNQQAKVGPDGEVTVWSQSAKGHLLIARLQLTGEGPGLVRRVSDGTISVTGSAGDDRIYISTEYFWGTAWLNGFGRSYFPGEINRFAADAGAGDDTFEMEVLGTVRSCVFSGGSGNDLIVGSSKSDTLTGNAGNDTINGGGGADLVRGNGGRDHLYGNGGDDRIYGGDSGDWLYGQAGNDQLFGEAGLDRLYGDDGGNDTLHGGGGDDVLVSRDESADQVFGDAGRDAAIADKDDVLGSVEEVL
ncbi:MAG TPA: hypothetical protein VF669_03740 [Tepidisphaeraceae bacterium]|jgi:uncharacterized delta-60 repeat protein